MSHTPGPWTAFDTTVYIGKTGTFLNNGEPAWGGFDLRACPNPNANAHLISAAPDLFEALQIALSYAGPSDDWVSKARQAITKAKGHT